MQSTSLTLLFKKMLIVFWTLWWLSALWTDVVGWLAHQKILIASWAPDANYPFLTETLAMYHTPDWLVATFFAGIVLWMVVASLCFLYASSALLRPVEVWMPRAELAFIVSLGCWLCFFLADQMVMKFDLEENHMTQGGFELLSFLALYILPNERSR